ncbi:putative AT hook motif-containing protein [Cryptosporidium felis]|nr:putative AT hook motif-containing protein [Cryptosporidium felis]
MKESSELRSNEGIESASSTLIEQPCNKMGTPPSTTCVSPLLEGKQITNNYAESILLNSVQNINQSIPSGVGLGPNLGFGWGLGFGINMNLSGINELPPSFPLMIPNQIYQVNGMAGSTQGMVPDYNSILRNYQLNSSMIPQTNILPINGVQIRSYSGLDTLLSNQSSVKFKEEKQLEPNTKPPDSQSTVVNPVIQSPLIPSNSQPTIVPQMLATYPGQLYQPLFVNGIDTCENISRSTPSFDLNPQENDKLNILLNSYLSNIATLTDTREGVKNYPNLNCNNFEKNSINHSDSLNFFNGIGLPDCSSRNNRLDNLAVNGALNSFPQKLNNVESCIPGGSSDIFRLSHTRKYRLGDQGRALLKSELSAYLRSNPEKRAEASKIADIRNATTKQLWQIAAMCGLEERFINLHAQSLAQSKGKVGLRGTKRRSNANMNASKVDSKGVVNDSFKFPNSTDSGESDFITNTNDVEVLADGQIDDPKQMSPLEKSMPVDKRHIKETETVETSSVKGVDNINISGEGLRSSESEAGPYQIEISGATSTNRIKVDA